jgi:hypothetical protein
MKPVTFLFLAGILTAGGAYAQSQGQSGTQAAASASSNTSAEASQSNGVQAGNSSSAAAAGQHNGTQAGSSAADDTSASANRGGVQASNGALNSTSAKNSRGSANSETNSTMNATLVHPVDAKKSKPGDRVVARTTRPAKSPDGTTLPKGTELVGHVTQAQARSKGQSESDLGIVFDKAVLKNGQQVPMSGTIQAIAAAQNAASAESDVDDLGADGGSMAGGFAGAGGSVGGGRSGLVGGGGGGGLGVGGVASGAGRAVGTVAAPVGNVASNAGNTVGGAAGTTANAANASRGVAGGLNAAGQLTSTSQGVFNMQGLNLASSTSNAAQGSVITSASRNVHLDSGTQLLVSATSAAQMQASK